MTGELIDVNVYVSRWPSRRVPLDRTDELVGKLGEEHVVQAWTGSFDALLHRDIGGVNERLARTCADEGKGLLVPLGTVHPLEPDWEEDMRRCHEQFKMPGIRLHPNYHGYKLDDPLVDRLLDMAQERKLIVQIALTMEDERTQPPLLQVPHVDVGPLVEHARKRPKLRLMLLNAFRSLRPDKADQLAEVGVLFDIAMLEGVGGVGNLVNAISAERIVFGSYAPFFALESAKFKMKESVLGGVQQQAIATGNARKFLPS